jgi:hypothetical protein
MPSHLHEILIEMFRERPAFVADLLGGALGRPVPAFARAELSAGELNDVSPTEYRADSVIILRNARHPVLAVIVEVQLDPKRRKRRSWPAYVATLHARLRCPVELLVICPSQRVANWCAKPVVIGNRCLVLTPVVLGPAQVPVVTDLDLARRTPELAVLSTLTHGGRADPVPVFEALFAALDTIDHDHANLYTDLVLMLLPAATRARLEKLMTTTTHQYQSDFARRYFSQGEAAGEARGEARGEAKAVLAILDARGVEVPDDLRTEITACIDIEQLDTWLRRAATAHKIQDLLG